MRSSFKALGAGALVAISVAAQAQTATVRVEGEGYLRFLREGRAVYAKTASLSILSGELKEKSGVSFLPPIYFPSKATGFRVADDGWVTAVTTSGETKVARLMLARFGAGGGLEASGSFLTARDRASLGFAGQEGLGKVVSINDKRGAINDKGQETDDKRQTTNGNGTPGVSGNSGTSEISNLKSQISNSPDHNLATPQPRNTATPQPRNTAKPQNHNAATRIVLPAAATVEGPRFTLGEIAEVQGQGAEQAKALDLGTAPVHGVPMLYSRERILARLTALGLEKAELSMAATIEIRRKGQIVTPDQLLEKARAAVESKLGLKGELTSSDKLADIHVPNGALEIFAEQVTTMNGLASVTLGVRVEGKRVMGRTIRLSGAILEPAVQAGGSVTVRFVSNGVVIEIAGRVRSSAAVGQTVEVTVSAGQGSGTSSHQGTVIAPGRVEVKL